MLFHLYVPRPDTSVTIAPASAVVTPADGVSVHPGRLTVDFEGNIYGAENLGDFATRVLVAAYRARDRAPTMARLSVSADELIRVGSFDLASRTFVEINDPDTLSEWLGDEPLPPVGPTAGRSEGSTFR